MAIPAPLAPLVATSVKGLIATGVNAVAGWFKGGGGDQVKATGARITNEIEATMDLNRSAFESGTIDIRDFDANWKALWMAYTEAAAEIGRVEPGYARGMTGDRSWGGKFGTWWQGTMHEFPMDWARDRLDSAGFMLPDFQIPWPLKGKYVDTNPAAQVPNALPSVQEALRQVGETAGPGGGILGGGPPDGSISTAGLFSGSTGTIVLVAVAALFLLGGSVKVHRA